MAVSNIEPELLRTFAERLSRFATEVDEMREHTSSALHVLGETWRDQQYSEFTERFAENYRRLERFIDETNAAVPRLNEAAAIIAAAQQVRL